MLFCIIYILYICMVSLIFCYISMLRKRYNSKTLFLLRIGDLWQSRGFLCSVLWASTKTHWAPRWAGASTHDLLSWTFLVFLLFCSSYYQNIVLFFTFMFDFFIFSYILRCGSIFTVNQHQIIIIISWLMDNKVFHGPMNKWAAVKHISNHEDKKPHLWAKLRNGNQWYITCWVLNDTLGSLL